jgi:glycosyltransferase involved in cell wall biosynthesis
MIPLGLHLRLFSVPLLSSCSMNILMVQRFDTANVGCAERIWRQAEGLVALGHEVTLVNFPHAIRRQSLPRLRPDAPPGVRVMELDHHGTAMPRNTRLLQQEVKRASLVHLWKSYPDIALPVLYALRKKPRPLHYDWDDLEGSREGIAKRMTGSAIAGGLMAFWEREILHWADTVTTASQAIRELALRQGFPAERIFPGPVGAVPPDLNEGLVAKWSVALRGTTPIVFIGQMEAEDFPMEVLPAIKALHQRHPRLRLVMIGDGSARAQLLSETERLGLRDQVLFTGYLPREETQAVLSLAKVFLFPLRDDLMTRCKSPLVVIEAMSHGVPVVGSAVGEVPTMLGDDGVLVQGLDTSAWEAGLRTLLDHPEESIRRGQGLKERFLRDWTWQRSVESLDTAYRTCLEFTHQRALRT